MAKSKNATTHHLGQKIHKNGIYKLKEHRHKSTKGCNLRWIRNRRHALKMDPTVIKEKNTSKRIQAKRDRKQ